MRHRPLFFRKTCDVLLAVFSALSIVAALGGMGWILWTVTSHGFSSLSREFLTSSSKTYGETVSGIASALLVTVMITAGATLISVPLALALGMTRVRFTISIIFRAAKNGLAQACCFRLPG